jgi:hypothetical protein
VDADKFAGSGDPDDDHALAAIDFEGDGGHAMGLGQGLEAFLDDLWKITARQCFARQREQAYAGTISLSVGVEIDKTFLNQGPQHMQAGARDQADSTRNFAHAQSRDLAGEQAQHGSGPRYSWSAVSSWGNDIVHRTSPLWQWWLEAEVCKIHCLYRAR